MRFAYADPPYVGQSAKHYDGLEVNHRLLVAHLVQDYPDGWALSASSSSLRELLPLCPENTRVGAWVKPFHAFKRGVRPAYAWEPLLFRGGRNPPAVSHPPPPKGGEGTTPRDWVSEGITLRKGLVGAKPPAFCEWVFDLLNVTEEDTLDDIFPGTGAVSEALAARRRRLRLFA